MFDFGFEFRDPWFLLLAPLALLVSWVMTQSSSSLLFSSTANIAAAPMSIRQRLSLVPPILMGLGVAALVVALARPRTPERETQVSREGIAIMMVVDLSSSMNARDLTEDVALNRLDVVKEVFTDFVLGSNDNKMGGRRDDLVGLVTFAGYADSVCPLTLDHGNLANIVKDLTIVEVREEDGTAVGDGLGLAVERLRRSKAKSRVAILLTDGVNNAGVIQPTKAAELAKEYDIKVYCIGAGTNGTAPVPSRDMFGRLTLVGMPVQIDEETLEEISDMTGGKYFRATDRDKLGEIYSAINELERTEVSEIRYLRYHEHFAYFLSSALGLLVLAGLLSSSLFRKLP